MFVIAVLLYYTDRYITKQEERDEWSHESPNSRESSQEWVVESYCQPYDETGHQAMDGVHLAHTETESLSPQPHSHHHYHHLPQYWTLQHLQEVDRGGGVVAVVIIDICHTTGVALPVHEGDDGHKVEGESHERNSELSQWVVEGRGQEDTDQGTDTDSNP